MYWNNFRKLASGLQRMDWETSPEKVMHLIVEVTRGTIDRIGGFIENNQGIVEKELRLIPSLAVTLPVTTIPSLLCFSQVKKVWENTPLRIFGNDQTGSVGSAHRTEHEFEYTGKGVTVAVLDTGIFPHAEFLYPENRFLAWKDFVAGKSDPYDDHGHGTRIAGIIAGNGAGCKGRYCGMAPQARLVGLKILDDLGYGMLSDLLAGIEWCVLNGPTLKIRVINCSFGTRSQDQADRDLLSRAVGEAWNRGIIVCACTGKVGPGYLETCSPGVNSKIITVGNLDVEKALVPEDERLISIGGKKSGVEFFTVPDLVTWKTKRVTLKKGGGYTACSEESAATPFVSGGIALILEKWPDLRPDQVKRLVKSKAVDLGLGPNLQGAGGFELAPILGKTTGKLQTAKERLERMFGLMRKFAPMLDKVATGKMLGVGDWLPILFPLLASRLLKGIGGNA